VSVTLVRMAAAQPLRLFIAQDAPEYQFRCVRLEMSDAEAREFLLRLGVASDRAEQIIARLARPHSRSEEHLTLSEEQEAFLRSKCPDW
jgi:hypothetical protein